MSEALACRLALAIEPPPPASPPNTWPSPPQKLRPPSNSTPVAIHRCAPINDFVSQKRNNFLQPSIQCSLAQAGSGCVAETAETRADAGGTTHSVVMRYIVAA